MKKFMILIMALLAYNFMFGQIISQYIETNSGSTPKGVEIWNNTGSSLDFSSNNLVIKKGTNGGTPSADYTLSSGSLAAGDVIVIGTSDLQTTTENNGSTFYVKSFTFNGDDALEVWYGTTKTDVFGIPGSDPGSSWDGNGVSTKNQNIQLKSGITTGDTDGWTDPSERFETVNTNPAGANGDEGFGIAPTSGGNSLPSITNISQSPSEDITSSTTVSISADVTDADGTISLVELHWGLSSGSLTNTISMSNGGSGDTYTTSSDIPAQSNGSTVYYEVYAEDDVPEGSTSAEYNYTVKDAASTTLPYLEQFNSDLGDCYTKSVSGDSKVWNWNSSGYAQMNGYNSGDTEEDWLIFPGVNLDNYTYEIIIFDTWYKYGTDDANNSLKLFYSTNYPGIGDPSSYSWTELSFTHPSAAETWTSSGEVDLSSIAGTSVYIGLKYHYEPGSYRWWEIDNVNIKEEPPNAITLSEFTAKFSADQLSLYWSTQSEVNNQGWNVYRGENENALQNNEVIQINDALINGYGTTSEQHDYQFVDEHTVQPGLTYWYWLESIDNSGATNNFGAISLTIPNDNGENPNPPNTDDIAFLQQNYPNPVTGRTEINFSLSQEGLADLSVYNLKGQKIITLYHNNITADEVNRDKKVYWNGLDENGNKISSGIYLYTLKTKDNSVTRKMIVAK